MNPAAGAQVRPVAVVLATFEAGVAPSGCAHVLMMMGSGASRPRDPSLECEAGKGAEKLGVIHEYPMSNLADGLSREGDIDVFVETGTYVGNSVAWASANFRRVLTIELNSEYQAIAKERHAALTNVTFVLGNSAQSTFQCPYVDQWPGSGRNRRVVQRIVFLAEGQS
jgi:hypothetical protein